MSSSTRSPIDPVETILSSGRGTLAAAYAFAAMRAESMPLDERSYGPESTVSTYPVPVAA